MAGTPSVIVTFLKSVSYTHLGSRHTSETTSPRLMIRDFIYSLFSFVILDPFPDKRYHIEVVSDAYQIKFGYQYRADGSAGRNS